MKFIFILIFLIQSIRLNGDSLRDVIQSIPSQDRSVLETFFRFLFCDLECGYTLFGKKPITVVCAPIQPSLEEATERLFFEKGWTTWMKYCHLFPSPRFILKKDIIGDNAGINLSLINKPLVYNAIVENLEIFQKILGNLSIDEIFKKICEGEKCIFDLKSPHPQALIGILLGYGKMNALNFQRESEIFEGLNRQLPPLAKEKTLDKLSSLELIFLKAYGHPKYKLKSKAPPLPSIEKDIKEIFEKRKFFTHFTSLIQFELPGFICWENDETSELKQSYSKTQAILRQVYKSGSILESTLRQWMASDESDGNPLISRSSP